MITPKSSARQLIQQRLETLSITEYDVASRGAYQNLRSVLNELYGLGDSPTLLTYRAFFYWREVDVSELERDYVHASFEYVHPKKHAREPRGVYDAIVVPLYGFTQAGYRLGHGGGWYDKLLAAQPRARRIGVGLEAGLIDFDVEEHDVPVDILITEKRCELLRDRTLG